MRGKLEMIVDLDLDRACGGANTQEGKGNLGIDARGVKIGLQGEYKSSRTDYASCLKTMSKLPGATPTSIAAACGKPKGSGQ